MARGDRGYYFVKDEKTSEQTHFVYFRGPQGAVAVTRFSWASSATSAVVRLNELLELEGRGVRELHRRQRPQEVVAVALDPYEVIHKARPADLEIGIGTSGIHCAVCGQRIHKVPGGQGTTWVHSDSGAVAAPNPAKSRTDGAAVECPVCHARFGGMTECPFDGTKLVPLPDADPTALAFYEAIEGDDGA